MHLFRLLPLTLVILFFFPSCSSDTESYDSFENLPEVTTEFLFEISESSGAAISSISDVKIGSNGTIIVADASASRMHLFDGEGNYLSTVLRDGRGPGEVQNLLGRLALSDDNRLMIYDQSLRRLSIFDLAENGLQHRRDLTLEQTASFFHLIDDKIYLYSSTSAATTDGDENDRLLEIDITGEILRNSIATFQRSDELMITTESMSMGMSTQHHEKNHVGFSGNIMAYNRSNRIGFTLYDLESGEPILETHLNRPRKELPASEKEEFVDEILDTGFVQRSQRSQLLADMPQYVPIVQTLKYDAAGTIWLKITDSENRGWLLFSDETGQPVGRLFEDMDGDVISVHDRHIYLSTDDEEGYPKLRVYRYEISEI